jgi:hypothetical protein
MTLGFWSISHSFGRFEALAAMGRVKARFPGGFWTLDASSVM